MWLSRDHTVNTGSQTWAPDQVMWFESIFADKKHVIVHSPLSRFHAYEKYWKVYYMLGSYRMSDAAPPPSPHQIIGIGKSDHRP